MNEKKIFESFQRLKGLQSSSNGVDMELAKELSYLKEKDKDGFSRYKVIMGYTEATWKAFVAQPELHISYDKAQRLVLLYNTYIKTYGFKAEEIIGIDSNSLCYVARRGILTKINVGEWVEKAKKLSRSDFQREVRFGNVDELECEHEEKVKTTFTCSKCGRKRTEKK